MSEFSITVKPTQEIWNATINGTVIPLRVWEGVTSGGLAIDAYVLSIVPDDDTGQLSKELPSFMVKSREMFTIEVEDDE